MNNIIDEFMDFLLIDKHYSKNTFESYKKDLISLKDNNKFLKKD